MDHALQLVRVSSGWLQSNHHWRPDQGLSKVPLPAQSTLNC